MATHLVSAHSGGQLVARCRDLGVPLLRVEPDGRTDASHLAPKWWLDRLVVESGAFTTALTARLPVWMAQQTHEVEPLWPGCWVAPIPIIERRRPVAFHVAVFLSEELIDSEQLHVICGQAKVDHTLAVQRARQHPMFDPASLGRMAAMLQWMSQDLCSQTRHVGELDTLGQQLGEAYEELNLVYKMSARMTVTQDSRVFLDEACEELQQVVGVKWLAMHLVDTDERLKSLRGKLCVVGPEPPADHTLESIGRALLARFGEKGEPVIVEQVESLGIPALNRLANRLLVVPLVRDRTMLGVLFGADKLEEGEELSSVDSKLVTSLAQNICIFLDNAMLYDDVQDMFMGTLRALVSAIDAKDTYTFGHSERVAWLSRCLARGAGLDERTCERVYLSGLVHDVGKIGVPEAVLTKPGRLTEQEFDMIKTHPRIGARILQDIRQMHDLLPGVLYHHERYDGHGYPDGLAGDSIPLFGRLICLADSFDAMTSDRTYRHGLPVHLVMEEIRHCSGTQFDPHLAEVFRTLDLAEFFHMLESHRGRTSPLHKEMGPRS